MAPVGRLIYRQFWYSNRSNRINKPAHLTSSVMQEELADFEALRRQESGASRAAGATGTLGVVHGFVEDDPAEHVRMPEHELGPDRAVDRDLADGRAPRDLGE
jgi:hypothetical protein